MEEISYKKHIKVNETQELIVCYDLLSENQKFHILCEVENADPSDKMNYCLIKDFTSDRKKAVEFIEMLARGEVLPIHVQDILEDYMYE